MEASQETPHSRSLERICVYCGSSDQAQNMYLDAACEMGRAMASRELTLVYGGGGTGLMGAVSRGARQAGGSAIGVIPEMFNTPQLVDKDLTDLRVVSDMHTRKAMMAELADAFVALPGGLGTFEELFEILTWAQIGLHSRPVAVLNVNGYYDPLFKLIEHAHDQGFLYAEHNRLLLSASQPEALLDLLAEHRPSNGPNRWITRED